MQMPARSPGFSLLTSRRMVPVDALSGSANTVGTTMLALLCREAKVPVVAPAETLKCDLARSSV
ncbi:MAG: hypothetical protein II863_18400, partial [Kiritimatiellae bacterium]|nr:hypothetical protein [Kiritimatiellia bacterium]